jgi:polyisoprenoid-binding protein YceI
MLLLMLLGAPAAADEWQFVLDPARSEVAFRLGATLHTVRGHFRVEHGEVRFDPDTGAASGEVVVDARSGVTGINARDRAMHESVLESERFPAVELHVEGLEIQQRERDALQGELVGRLELHGSSHEVRIPVRGQRVADGEAQVEGAFRVPYAEWGLTNPSRALLRVDPYVELTFRAEGSLGPATQ